MNRFSVALVQMDSQENKKENLAFMLNAVDAAASRGASMIMFPETSLYCGRMDREEPEDFDGEASRQLQEAAGKNGIYVHTGTFHMKKGEDEKRPSNTSQLFAPDGKCICTYSKLHMFEVDIPGFRSRESDTVTPGNSLVLADTQLGKMGLSVCYDLRFPEMYRLLAVAGAQLILVPACFYMGTGRDHWETLLRARAIENGCYVLAANQIGLKKDGSVAYGRSMAVDPWGTVISCAGDQTGVIYADVDLERIGKVRGQIPGLQNRRGDIYSLETTRLQICRE